MNWDGLNCELRRALEIESRIDRLELHQYSIGLGIDSLYICSYSKIEAWQGDVLLFDIDADYRKRSLHGFRICEIVGKRISLCTCRDSGVHIAMADDHVLIFRRDDSMESGSINAANIFPSMF